MMPSIRRFLLFNLLISITITSSITAVGNYFLDTADIQRHLDTHLSQTTEFLNIILINTKYSPKRLQQIQHIINSQSKTSSKLKEKNKIFPKDRFQFQVWDENKNMILHSRNSIASPLSTNSTEEFNNITIHDKTWRVYTMHNDDLHLTISVAEPYDFRQQLEQRITWDNLLIILWTYPLLGLLIWLTIGKGLNSLKKIADKLSKRSATNFSPIDLKNVPIEIKPLIEELNLLFFRLHQEFERGKRFSSDAAHELRTPLAALKTQTQVALMATDETERKTMLNKVIQGVDRCSHLVGQLLTLSRLGREETLGNLHSVDIAVVAGETLAQLAPFAIEKDIELELIAPDTHPTILGDETILSILIRNLVDNAIRYTPNKGNIEVHITDEIKTIVLSVIDSGPGIPSKLRARVFERFYRILGTTPPGSGLGLAIVHQIIKLHNATIKLLTPKSGKGLEVKITFPALSKITKK